MLLIIVFSQIMEIYGSQKTITNGKTICRMQVAGQFNKITRTDLDYSFCAFGQPWITIFRKEIQLLINDLTAPIHFVWNVILTQRLIFFGHEPLPPAASLTASIFSAVSEISTHQRLQHLRKTTKWWVYTLISPLNSAFICCFALHRSIVALPLLEDESENEDIYK